MDPEHDRQMRVGRRAGRTCDAEVEAVELGLLERLIGDAVLRKVEQLLLDALEARLRAYRAREPYQCEVSSQTREVVYRVTVELTRAASNQLWAGSA